MDPLTFLLGALLLYRYLDDAPSPAWTSVEDLDHEILRETLAAHRASLPQRPELTPLIVQVVVSGALRRDEAFDWADQIYLRAGLAHVVGIRPTPVAAAEEAIASSRRPVNQTTLDSIANVGREVAPAEWLSIVEPEQKSIEEAASYAYAVWTKVGEEPVGSAVADATADAMVAKLQPAMENWLRERWTGDHCQALESAAQLLTWMAETLRDGAAWLTRELLLAFGVPEPVAVALGALAGLLMPVGQLTSMARALRIIGVGLCAANGHLGDCACRAGLATDLLTHSMGGWLSRELSRPDWANAVFGAFAVLGMVQQDTDQVRPAEDVRQVRRVPIPRVDVWELNIGGAGTTHDVGTVSAVDGWLRITATLTCTEDHHVVATCPLRDVVGLPGVVSSPGASHGEVVLDMTRASAAHLNGTAVFAPRPGFTTNVPLTLDLVQHDRGQAG